MKAKVLIKRLISLIFGRSIVSINYDLLKDKVVSFDIFDTLILRKCEKPSDVFNIMEQRSYQRIGVNLTGFAKKRKQSERMARAIKKDSEITLDEIYCYMPEYSTKVSREVLKEFEIETEMSECIANREMLNLYNRLIENGTKVFLISDMYLSKRDVEKILNNCGIVGYQKLYVSSDSKMTKSSGKLFGQVVTDNNLEKKNMIHIGDNPKGDFFVPKYRNNIAAILYKRC